MKRISLVILCVIMSLVYASCGKKTEETALEKIQKNLLKMDSYTCLAQITQVSNKGEKSYELTQEARSTGEYRIIVISPEKIAGTVTVFNGTSVFQYNPKVSGSLKVDVPYSMVRNEILLTTFVKNYVNSEDVTVETSKMEGAKHTVLEAKIPGENPYLASEKLWVDNETLLPSKLVIFDDKNTERIIVTYKKIEYNTELEDNIFQAEQ